MRALARRLRLPLLLAAGAGLAAAGCGAAAQDTPAQALAAQRWSACRYQADDVQLQRIEPDGRIWFWYIAINARNKALACLREQAAGGPALPEPVTDMLPRGS